MGCVTWAFGTNRVLVTPRTAPRARTTGRVGVAVVPTGQAYSDSVPVLVISPGMPLRHPAAGNGLLHETRDQQVAMRAVAAASLRPTSVGGHPGRHGSGVCDHARSTPAGAVTEAATRLNRAAFPVILAGGGANRAASELRAVAERLGAPVVTTTNGKGVLPEGHPLALGRASTCPPFATWSRTPTWLWPSAPSWHRPTCGTARCRWRVGSCASTSTRSGW